MNAITLLRDATTKLKNESGCDEWSVRIKKGKAQLVRCSLMDSGKYKVWPISYWMSIDAMPEFINSIPR